MDGRSERSTQIVSRPDFCVSSRSSLLRCVGTQPLPPFRLMQHCRSSKIPRRNRAEWRSGTSSNLTVLELTNKSRTSTYDKINTNYTLLNSFSNISNRLVFVRKDSIKLIPKRHPIIKSKFHLLGFARGKEKGSRVFFSFIF